ncbi:MAG: hypothetical protein A2840_01270 [Candidatus Buchananbacteria bacterium RIFCSPHIGHO2_01_FULL_47_11b]|uniref:CDP-alcohol phosphatidyltransferase n=1 Tax=Candidatus Buchananbacteria bacterium RIFCSPHIGHO2_01_FULL_47_11b TaxID=1797537 RepID=A0A1G1Y5V5_9BACT|nr:MAG: hypothetical protein A2840_01270 [Candidatus Buchananbacteria bacterium RIFCSPHIGHO2_01_FULL_47_11b]
MTKLSLLERFASLIERIIIKIMDGVVSSKERLLLPWFSQHWPRHWLLSANALTIYRACIALGVIAYLSWIDWRYDQLNRAILFSLIGFAALLDLFDGIVARALDTSSSVGSVLDKFADRLLLLPIAVVEFWPRDRVLVWIGSSSVVITLVITLINYWRINRREVPTNPFAKWTMTIASCSVLLGLFPNLLPLANALAWLVVVSGAIAVYKTARSLRMIIGTNSA